MLKQRVITALVLAPLALFGVFGLPLSSFMYLMDAVVLVAAWEWANLSGYKSQKARGLYVLAAAAVVALMHLIYSEMSVYTILPIAVAAWSVALLWVIRYPLTSVWDSRWVRAVIGVFVLIPCWVAFVGMKAAADGEMLILLLFLLVWGADVGAYFSGKRFGKTKLAPHVSPGKTREGLYGGLVACLVVSVAFAVITELGSQQTILLIILSLVTGLVSVLGDLFESMLKRHRGIKDSSQLLPGHGGVLDRIDSLTAASPLFVLGMQYVVFA